MKTHYLEFEQPIAQADATVAALRATENADPAAITAAEQMADQLAKDVYSKLSPWQTSLVSRHPQRPYTLDYIERLFTDFRELHGDRSFADDEALVCGLARFEGQPCAVIGHQKGRDTKERGRRNFGMPRPEGYRKAKRIMELAEKFNLPIFTFIDTPGAYPGIGAEERGQSEAIGHNLYVMAQLKVPLIATVIGEGGSGGALAIAVGDTVLMLQHSTYSVISPEGCASILWKSSAKAPDAAAAMGLTSARIKSLGLIDKIINEPTGGAHRDWDAMGKNLKKALHDAVKELRGLTPEQLIARRHERLMSYGKFTESNAAH